jgi:DNA primase
VVLFPDKDDPDSYIRKVGDTAFQEYIRANAKDFISFKTELFAEEARNNPVKKAEAIREVIQSIAKVPDSIKREVFIQRCSQLFGIDEQVLHTEYSKMVRQERARPGPAHEPEPDYIPEEFQDPAELVTSDDDLILRHEREVVRLLMNYSAHKLPDEQPFVPYLLSQLDDVEFKVPLMGRLVAMIQDAVQHSSYLSPDFFINHPDQEVRQEAIQLMTEKFEISPNWETHQIIVPVESDMLQFAADTSVLRLKWRHVQQMIKDNMELLKVEKDFEEVTRLLTVLKTLQQFEVQMGAQLGVVVAR